MPLLPGLVVARRDDRHLQVGLDPPHCVVAPDDPDVRRLLADLRAGRDPRPASDRARRCLADLRSAGLVVDIDAAAGRARRRAGARVALEAPPGFRAALGALLGAAGCGVAAAPAPVLARLAPPGPVTSPGPVAERADLTVVVGAPEAARERLDRLVRDDLPHLVVGGAVEVVVGPLVVPGATACMRCVDAHHAERDPRRAVVLEQLTGSRSEPGWDAVTTALVAAWVVRDVLAWVDGSTPTTWSTTVAWDATAPAARGADAAAGPSGGATADVTADVTAGLVPRVRRWTRHPHCGCTWLDALTG